MSILEEALRVMMVNAVRAQEDELRRLLGMWASEAEPCVAVDPHGTLIGLMVEGGHHIILKAWE